MSKIDDLRAQLDRANTALANVADDIRRLTEQISTDLTPAEVEEIQQKLTSHANALQAVADQTPEPAPPAPPAEPVQ